MRASPAMALVLSPEARGSGAPVRLRHFCYHARHDRPQDPRRLHRGRGATQAVPRTQPQGAVRRGAGRGGQPLQGVGGARGQGVRHRARGRRLARDRRGQGHRRRLHRDLAVHALRDDHGRPRRGQARALRGAHGHERRGRAAHARGLAAEAEPRGADRASAAHLEVDPTVKAKLAEGYVGEVLSVELQGSQGSFVSPEGPLHWRHDVSLSGHNILNMGIWYEAMMRWVGPARRIMAMSKVAVPRRKDEKGVSHEVKVPDHVDILATLGSGAVAHLRFSAITGLSPAPQAWIFGSEGTLRIEADAKRLSGGRRSDKELREISIPAEKRVGWRVEEEFVNAIRGREKVTHTNFEDGVRYMEFTDAVTKSAQTGQAIDVAPL